MAHKDESALNSATISRLRAVSLFALLEAVIDQLGAADVATYARLIAELPEGNAKHVRAFNDNVKLLRGRIVNVVAEDEEDRNFRLDLAKLIDCAVALASLTWNPSPGMRSSFAETVLEIGGIAALTSLIRPAGKKAMPVSKLRELIACARRSPRSLEAKQRIVRDLLARVPELKYRGKNAAAKVVASAIETLRQDLHRRLMAVAEI